MQETFSVEVETKTELDTKKTVYAVTDVFFEDDVFSLYLKDGDIIELEVDSVVSLVVSSL